MPSEDNDCPIEDLKVPQGTDLFWAFELEPFDGTGCSAQFIVDWGMYPVTIVITSEGVDQVTSFSAHVPAADLSTKMGVYSWKHLVTFSDGTVLQYGRGSLLVEV